jgi:hypothetical protein
MISLKPTIHYPLILSHHRDIPIPVHVVFIVVNCVLEVPVTLQQARRCEMYHVQMLAMQSMWAIHIVDRNLQPRTFSRFDKLSGPAVMHVSAQPCHFMYLIDDHHILGLDELPVQHHLKQRLASAPVIALVLDGNQHARPLVEDL